MIRHHLHHVTHARPPRAPAEIEHAATPFGASKPRPRVEQNAPHGARHACREPLKRFCTVDEIAAMVRLLVGPEGTFITGQTIHVNGGEFLT